MRVLLIAVFIGMVTASPAAPVAGDTMPRPIPPLQQVVTGIASPAGGGLGSAILATGAITGRVTSAGGAAIAGIFVTAGI